MNKYFYFSPQCDCRGVYSEALNATWHQLNSTCPKIKNLLTKLKKNTESLSRPQTVSSFRLPMTPSSSNTTRSLHGIMLKTETCISSLKHNRQQFSKVFFLTYPFFFLFFIYIEPHLSNGCERIQPRKIYEIRQFPQETK